MYQHVLTCVQLCSSVHLKCFMHFFNFKFSVVLASVSSKLLRGGPIDSRGGGADPTCLWKKIVQQIMENKLFVQLLEGKNSLFTK